MLKIGQKVRYKTYRGIVTYVGMDGSWYNIRTNKGRDFKVVPFNMIRAR